jgi:hypothetical protein
MLVTGISRYISDNRLQRHKNIQKRAHLHRGGLPAAGEAFDLLLLQAVHSLGEVRRDAILQRVDHRQQLVVVARRLRARPAAHLPWGVAARHSWPFLTLLTLNHMCQSTHRLQSRPDRRPRRPAADVALNLRRPELEAHRDLGEGHW